MLLEKNVGEMKSSNAVETATFGIPSVVEGAFYGMERPGSVKPVQTALALLLDTLYEVEVGTCLTVG